MERTKLIVLRLYLTAQALLLVGAAIVMVMLWSGRPDVENVESETRVAEARFSAAWEEYARTFLAKSREQQDEILEALSEAEFQLLKSSLDRVRTATPPAQSSGEPHAALSPEQAKASLDASRAKGILVHQRQRSLELWRNRLLVAALGLWVLSRWLRWLLKPPSASAGGIER